MPSRTFHTNSAEETVELGRNLSRELHGVVLLIGNLGAGKTTLTKGIVEGFTLRSIRLRHPSGQLHTIPFGDLGKIANFSRDWAIVRYDFSFPRDADIEKVCHAVDGIDSELQGDPDYRLKILEPLKMQGVVGVTDNTLVVQFRFAAQPGNPEAIQRDVMIRMMRAFKDQGIEFGNATVGG